MEAFIIARVIHVLCIVLWIGGVAMVTLVLLPAIKTVATPDERVELFEKIERRFATQSRITTLLAGISGFYMVAHADLYSRFSNLDYWWMAGMFAVWLLFTLMFFVMEPLFLHKWFLTRAKAAPAATFALILNMHRLLLTVSLVVAAGAVAGSHGWV